MRFRRDGPVGFTADSMSLFTTHAVIDGLSFPLSGLPIPYRKRRHLIRGDYETPERALVQRFVEPGMAVLELGASLGILSTFIARRIGPEGKLLSVEADPSLRRFWERNLSHNGLKGRCVHALACPIWQDAVPARFLATAFRPCDNKLSGRVADVGDGAGADSWKTIRGICTEEDFHPDALVVDIEGTETAWLDEPIGIPPAIRLIIAEFHPQYTGPDQAARCVQALLDEGFRLVGFQNHAMAVARA